MDGGLGQEENAVGDSYYSCANILYHLFDKALKALRWEFQGFSMQLMCCSLYLNVRTAAFLLLLSLLSFPTFLSAQRGEAPVEIRRVQFESEREDWLRVRIELRGNRNPSPTARNDRFVDRVKVTCTLAYQFETGFDFYQAEAELIGMEQNQSTDVSFLLPGFIVERDRIRQEPFAYLIELEVGGETLPLQPEGVSPSIRSNPTAAQSLKTRAAAEAEPNDGILVPVYLAPLMFQEGNDAAGYIRRQPAGR